MKESLIEFETAKLAKEKGFNILTEYSYYDENSEYIKTEFLSFEAHKYKGFSWNVIYKPTQGLLQKWLREIHKIDIAVNDYNFGEAYIPSVSTKKDFIVMHLGHFPCYDSALEKGLQEALKLI
jgi:hypothetical protein